MISPEEVVQLYYSRRRTYSKRLARMEELRQAYAGDLDIPLPELDRTEKPMVANLIAQGLDQAAMRVASTIPNVRCPPEKPGFKNSEQAAELRRNIILGYWDANRLPLLQRKRARWLMGYASAPVMIRPDPVRQVPLWQARNPMTALGPPGDDLDPVNMIFSFKKPLAWLRRIYPESMGQLDLGQNPSEVSGDTQLTIVEYADCDWVCQVVLGLAPAEGDYQGLGSAYPRQGRPWVEIERQPNLAGVCPVVNPTTIGLDDPVGYYDGLIGLYWWQSKLMALGGIAAQRDVFPDEWEVENPNDSMQVEVEADGLAGIRGRIKGGTIQSLHATPGQQTMGMLNVMERNMRLTGGIPAEMTGEAAINVRTARRGAQILSSAIDFRIQECQSIFEAALEEENKRAIAVDKAYFGMQRKSFYVSWNGQHAQGDYIPGEALDTDNNQVRFSFAGTDANELVIAAGQRIGMETMSHHRFMEIDPYIDDPELEKQRIIAEGLDRALLQSVQQGVASGMIPPADAARISQLVLEKKKTLYDAIQTVQREAQERQATAGEPGTPAGPVEPGAPEAQPGLAAPGAGAEAGTIPGPNQGQMNLQNLITNLRRTATPV